MLNIFEIIADILLLASALGAGAYCWILSRRLSKLTSIDKGLGGAIAVLSAQVDDLTKILEEAKQGTEQSITKIDERIAAAENVSSILELLIASASEIADPSDEDVKGEQPPSRVDDVVSFGSSRRAQNSEPAIFARHEKAEERVE